ncbi:MAG: LysM peptidoglycan-binding domain-containing protein [Variovorax sp.]|nr:MAG: LysM peptidoglycan-binding domain-containing protein [Variovorax sp.]
MNAAGWARVGAALALTGALAAVDVQAATAAFLQHRVVEGDTLASIGARYLRAPARWHELQAFNQIGDPARLVPGSVVRVPRRWVRPASMTTVKVEFVQGEATGRMPALDAAPPTALATGDAVTEGTRLQIPKDGYLRLRLADGSVVRVQADSDIELKRLRGKRPGGSYQSVIEVHKGKVESEVAPQPRGRMFEIQAPGAVASVRGTRFDVSVGSDGRVATAVTEGVVSLKPSRRLKGQPRAANLVAGQGAVLDGRGQVGPRRTLPAAPDLSRLPLDFEDIALMTLQLAPVPEAGGGYEVRIARDEALQDVLRNGVFKAERVQFAALQDGDYTLGVRALDPDGLAGHETRRAIRVHARPVPPLYLSPATNGPLLRETGQLVCSEVADAGGVLFEVSAQPDFSDVRLRETRRDGCRLGIEALLPGDYWWRVASLARGAGGARRGPFAAGQPFTVVPTPRIGALELDDSGEAPTLRWAAQPGERFRAQLARDEAFMHLLADVDLEAPVWTLAGQPRGQFFVRLQARDASGLSGPFSPAWRVRIGAVVRTGGGGLTSSDGAPIERP